MFKKLLTSFLIGLILFLSVTPRFLEAKAAEQRGWYSPSLKDFIVKVYDTKTSPTNDIFGERYTAAQVLWITYSLFTAPFAAFGLDGALACAASGNIETCWDDAIKPLFNSLKSTSFKSDQTKGLAGVFSVVGQNPVSGIVYTKNTLAKLHFIPEANAQNGFGYGAANSVLELWKITRNFAFFLLVLVVIVLAFMIMFRVKLNPQTVIGIQTAIPKIVIALILITFSYAIAGFLIDLMYVVIGILALFVRQGGLTAKSVPELFLEFTTKYNVLNLLFYFWIWFIVASLSSILSAANPATFLTGIVLLILAVLSVIPLTWYSFKIFILMFKNFVMILLSIVTAPLEILGGAVFPGMGFGSWLKKMMGLLAVYPLWSLLFFLAFFFLTQGIPDWIIAKNEFIEWMPFDPATKIIGKQVWDPPLTTGALDWSKIIWVIIGYVIVIMTPKVTKLIQGFMEGKPFDFETAIGQEIGGQLKGAWDMTGGPMVGAAQKYGGERALVGLANRLYYGSKKGGGVEGWRADNRIAQYFKSMLQFMAGERREPSVRTEDKSKRINA